MTQSIPLRPPATQHWKGHTHLTIFCRAKQKSSVHQPKHGMLCICRPREILADGRSPWTRQRGDKANAEIVATTTTTTRTHSHRNRHHADGFPDQALCRLEPPKARKPILNTEGEGGGGGIRGSPYVVIVAATAVGTMEAGESRRWGKKKTKSQNGPRRLPKKKKKKKRKEKDGGHQSPQGLTTFEKRRPKLSAPQSQGALALGWIVCFDVGHRATRLWSADATEN